MIDNQEQVERLLRRLTDVLPLAALATPALLADLRERSSAAKITWHCRVTDVFYTGALEAVGRPLSYFVENGRKPQIVMNDFSSWIDRSAGGAYPIFVGFNAPFDWAFINWYFHTYLGDNPFGISGLDVKSFYMGMTGCSWAETRSSRIPERYKGLHKHTHNALDDAIEQAELFEKLWQESKTKNSSKVDQSR